MENGRKMEKLPNQQRFNFALDVPVDRLEQLLNNSYLSDVAFKVGSTGLLMYAHKLILTLASEVFYAQFSGGFAESSNNNREHPIVIDDIEPNVFMEILRYIYCSKIGLNEDNMLDIYYASQKYLLKTLNSICEDLFTVAIDEDNVLEISIANQRYGFAVVDELCLKFICDNPLKYFRQKDFLALSQQTMESIVSAKKMNCQMEHIREAIDRWQTSSGGKVSTPKSIRMQCRKLALYGPFRYDKDIDTEITINVRKPIALYGMGIFVGVKRMPDIANSVSITINIDSHICASKMVPLKRDFYVKKIMFRKQVILNESSIKVTVCQQWLTANAAFFCLQNCNAVDRLGDVKLTLTGKRDGTSCISYLLFNVEKE